VGLSLSNINDFQLIWCPKEGGNSNLGDNVARKAEVWGTVLKFVLTSEVQGLRYLTCPFLDVKYKFICFVGR